MKAALLLVLVLGFSASANLLAAEFGFADSSNDPVTSVGLTTPGTCSNACNNLQDCYNCANETDCQAQKDSKGACCIWGTNPGGPGRNLCGPNSGFTSEEAE